MAANRILEDDELSSPVSSERPDTRPAIARARAALSRHRVLVGSLGIAVVAVIAWRCTVRGESKPVAPSAKVVATPAPERRLEITVLGVHDIVAAAVPMAPPEPPVAVPPPAAAPAEPPPAPVSAPPRAVSVPRSPSRAQSSAAKASALPVAAVKPAPPQESRVEIVPAKPQPKPDGPPMEANPYVYK